MPRVAVIGATGTVGRALTSALVAAKTEEVVAISRTVDPSSVPRGVRAVRADLAKPESLDAALGGVDALFLVWTAPAEAVAAAIERVARHVPKLILLSAPHRTAHPLFQQTNPMAALPRSPPAGHRGYAILRSFCRSEAGSSTATK